MVAKALLLLLGHCTGIRVRSKGRRSLRSKVHCRIGRQEIFLWGRWAEVRRGGGGSVVVVGVGFQKFPNEALVG